MSETINYKSPYYLQVRQMILDRINANTYQPGDSIPSETDLASDLGINRLTVRAALSELVDRGIIRKIRGKGSYVVGPELTHDMEKLRGFSQTTRDSNHSPKINILSMYLRQAGDYFADLLNIDSEDDIYFIKRLDYVDEQPMSLEEIYIPEKRLPRLKNIDLNVYSLSEVYAMSGVEAERADESIDLVSVGKSDATLLDLGRERHVLLLCCLTYDQNNRAIEYSRNYTRFDNSRYLVNFRNTTEG